MQVDHRVWPFVVGLVMFSSAPAVGWSQAAESDRGTSSRSPAELKQWFLSEYPAAYERLSAPLANLAVQVQQTEADVRLTPEEVSELSADDPVRWSRVADRARVYRNVEAVAYIRGESRLLEADFTRHEAEVRPAAMRVTCYTPEYTFLLEKAQIDDAYLIFRHSNEETVMKRYGHISLANTVNPLAAAYRMFDLDVRRLLDRPDSLTVTESANKNGDELVRVSFHGLPEEEFWHESGWVRLAPGADWAIIDYEILDHNPASVRTVFGEVEYGQWANDRLIFPKSLKEEEVFDCTDGRAFLRLGTSVFDEPQMGKVEQVQFTLPSYGLPNVPISSVSDKPVLTVDSPVQIVGLLRAGESQKLSYVLRNQSSSTVRLIGAEGGCNPNGCVEVPGLPIDIPPESDTTIKVTFHAPRIGDFCRVFQVYTDQPSQPTVRLEVRGTARSE